MIPLQTLKRFRVADLDYAARFGQPYPKYSDRFSRFLLIEGVSKKQASFAATREHLLALRENKELPKEKREAVTHYLRSFSSQKYKAGYQNPYSL